MLRPSLYPALADLFARKFFLPNRDNKNDKEKAKQWCIDNQTDIDNIYKKYHLNSFNFRESAGEDYILSINEQILKSDSNFGGPGDLNLIYSICESLNATAVIETGVAYGWSSSAILESVCKRNGCLVSIDMPMPKQTSYDLIGIAVKDKHKKNWELIKRPDKYGLIEGLRKLNGVIEICHYDSDKNYFGRKWAYPKIYSALVEGGFLISDDIEDNLGFKDFVESINADYTVHCIDGKYVGIIRKT
jgi:predicted O-methyltransferase YrrM